MLPNVAWESGEGTRSPRRTGFWLACPACGNRGKHDPLTKREFARSGTGVPGRIPSKAFGANVLLWLQKNPATNAKELLARLGQPIRGGSATPSCGPCSAG